MEFRERVISPAVRDVRIQVLDIAYTLLFTLQNAVYVVGLRPLIIKQGRGGWLMRASAITTLIAALGLSVVGAAAALAGEYRGSLDGVDTSKNTITVTGVTIQANGYPIANLDPTQNYVVSWEKQGSQNVLLNIQPDESGGSSHK